MTFRLGRQQSWRTQRPHSRIVQHFQAQQGRQCPVSLSTTLRPFSRPCTSFAAASIRRAAQNTRSLTLTGC